MTILALSLFPCMYASAQDSVAEIQVKTVEDYVAAFNAHDVDAMLELVTDNIQWLSVDGDQLLKETNNKEELRASLTDYFESCEGCYSSLEHIYSTGERVMALEIAIFTTGHGTMRNQSMSVYEFVGPRIRRVYYFPVEN